MPAKVFKTSKRKVILDARPDRPDLRDRIYQPPLVSLPPEYPPPKWISVHLQKYCKAGLILNQGEEGACTGFGLAGVINYLLYRQCLVAKLPPPPRVSMRMIYHLARKYDEWPGEDYEGSSCRGAMKGWFHHGVCSDELWPYRDKKGDAVFVAPDPKWAENAAKRPIGAYYRVMSDSIADLQAAINEVGAIYVSSDVHKGWDAISNTKKSVPTIPWKPGTKPDGGHAFALVGYDAHGFIVQNSWGEDWGYHGFARLMYEDWLTNGDDAWVAVLGAPIAAKSPAIILSSTRTVPTSAPQLAAGLVNGATADAVAEAPRSNVWSTEVAVDHTVILGNDGLPDHVTIEDANAAASVERVCYELPKTWLKNPKQGGRRIVIYAHGGLNDLTAGLARVKVMGPWFEKNGIYPIFIAWQSGYVDSIKDIIDDLIGSMITEARGLKTASLFEEFSDARDYLIEKAAIIPARPIWSQMKQNAIAASTGEGGMVQLAQCFSRLGQEYSGLEIHLVGHSAGSILLGAFLKQLQGKKLSAITVSLYAPACTVGFANDTYVPAAKDKIIDAKRVAFDILSDGNEIDDTVGPYGKSLLYLVSRALEPMHKTPILGMEATWNPALDKNDLFSTPSTGKPNPDVADWRKAWLKMSGAPEVLSQNRVLEEVPAFTIKSVHGCFDNWIGCIERTLMRILGLSSINKLPVRIMSLRDF